MEKEKLYVLVRNFAWTNEDLEIFETKKDAEEAFKRFTDFRYSDKYFDQDDEEYNEKFSETKIYEVDLPSFLAFKHRRGDDD